MASALTRAARSARSAAILLATATAAAVLASPAAARADVDVTAQFGHGGAWIADAATPLEVSLSNTAAAPVQVHLRVSLSGFGDEDSFLVERDVPLGPNALRREAFILPGPSSWQPNLTVGVETSPAVPVRSRVKTGDRGRLEIELTGLQRTSLAVAREGSRPVGVLLDGRSAVASRLAGLEFGEMRGKGYRSPEPVSVLAVDAETLRLAPLALDGLETLVVCDPDATFCADPQHVENLLDWVALGGRLVVSLGEKAPSFATSPLASFLPARWGAVDRADYAELVDLLVDRACGVPRRDGPLVTLVPAEDATVRARGLLVERRFGDGWIAVSAADLRTLLETAPQDAEPLRRIADPFLFAAGHADPWPEEQRSWRQEFDVAPRIGRVLQQEAFRPPPFGAVMLALIAYVLVVGPVDWIVLKRLRKERYTTFTFAGAVLAFTVLAYGVSLLLFSADAVANRVTFVQLASGGRPGRELVRVHDLVGWYAPTGGTRRMTFPLPGAVLGSKLPGLQATGRVGASLPVVVTGNDPLAPRADVEVAFRSQRVVHSELTGTSGRTIDAHRPEGDDQSVEVTNTLPVDLLECWVFLPGEKVVVMGRVPAGGSAVASGARPAAYLRWEQETGNDLGDVRAEVAEAAAAEMRRFLAHVAASPMTSSQPPSAHRALRLAGIVQDAPGPGRALVVGVADELPLALPGAGGRGRAYVVVTKEVDLK